MVSGPGQARNPRAQWFPASANLQALLLLAALCPVWTAEVAQNFEGLLATQPGVPVASKRGEIGAKFKARVPPAAAVGSAASLRRSADAGDCGRRSQKHGVRPSPSVLTTSLSSHVVLTAEVCLGLLLRLFRRLPLNMILTRLLICPVSKWKLKP